jgi:hypothetical protein
MTRRRVLFGLLVASVVLACFAGLWIASRPRVTRERFEQVKKGMSREEVIRTVGGPPWNYVPGSTDYQPLPYPGQDWWLGVDAWLMVQFDADDTAILVTVVDDVPRPPTLTERIRRWLGL